MLQSLIHLGKVKNLIFLSPHPKLWVNSWTDWFLQPYNLVWQSVKEKDFSKFKTSNYRLNSLAKLQLAKCDEYSYTSEDRKSGRGSSEE